jgi:glucose-1-phosphate thymidylyltransferase
MVRVAGKPILGHILDELVDASIDDVVIVVGVMKDLVVDYVDNEYGSELSISYAEQDRTEGLGHCIYQTRRHFTEESMCIMLDDMLFENRFEEFLDAHRSLGNVDGSIGVKRVEAPSNYGIVSLEDGEITKLEEKPEDPDSNLAISGIYFIEDTRSLFDSLAYFIDNDIRGAGDEYQLTDALQRMLEGGAQFGTFQVGDWYDCGRPETLINANHILLESKAHEDVYTADNSVVIPPVDIGDDVKLVESVVGPYVSIDDGARIVDSRIRDSIVGTGSTLSDVNLAETIIGNRSDVSGTPSKLNVGDSSEVNL